MSSLQRRGFLAACASAVAAGCLGSPPDFDPDAADAWPMQRADPGGTNGTDAPGPRTEPEVAWTTEVSGMGAQPDPVVHGDRLYHGAFDRFYALDPETGEMHWELSEHGSWLQPALAAAPAYGDVMPVVATRSGYAAISATGGFDTPGRQRDFETRWKRTTVEDPGGRLALTVTRPAPPVVAEGTLYAATEDAVVALDAATGTTEWTTRLPGANRERVAVAAGRVFVSSYARAADGGLVALDADSGERLWGVPETDVYVLPPTATEDAVFFHDRDALYAYDAASGDELWRVDDFGGIDDSRTPLAVGGGRVVAVGEREREREVVAFDGDSGERLWRVPGGTHETPPVVTGDTIYVPEDAGVRALDAATGDELWTRGDGDVRGLAVVGTRAYAVTATGTLYALEGSA
ncbi:PQQ-binding-like beta-propeller repeat protein [Halobacterium jilantaiense]|uniref:Outer membrane protein assembly factor BamB, contains PQQ-like beta-propeller repeat n=1 Tax=Halobacterium jilantaiense TaxID=355548 RepID=A0A1I0QPH0_9EURY|nr:PQQ-binding-like beta-propeller repeat protein [Halobacterium jilantaiense]SEW29360.1 Outer membrane protein assembly factor BamB, contains PQQ-like beta-propeller repeat [Halobacterium jilantaiense]